MTPRPSPSSVAEYLARAASEFRRRARRRLEIGGVEGAERDAAMAAEETKIENWKCAAMTAALRTARENY